MNQQENLRGAILKYKAHLMELTQALAQPLERPGQYGRPVRVSPRSKVLAREQQLRLERQIAELEAELSRINQPATDTTSRDYKVMGKNLEKYLQEAKMTRDQLAAEAVGGDTKALRKHISGDRKMRPQQEQDYETVLSKRVGRKVSLTHYTPPS